MTLAEYRVQLMRVPSHKRIRGHECAKPVAKQKCKVPSIDLNLLVTSNVAVNGRL
jgi:hypothetical protein